MSRPCSWERCAEPATATVGWRREAPTLGDQKRELFDVAHYCDAHAQAAKNYGAISIELRELDAAGVERFRQRTAHLPGAS